MPIAFVITSMISVQIGASCAKRLFPLIGPIPTTMLRISFAALLLSLVWQPWKKKISRKSFQVIGLYGMALGTMNLTFYLALTRIPLGICVALEFVGALAVSIFYSRKKNRLRVGCYGCVRDPSSLTTHVVFSSP